MPWSEPDITFQTLARPPSLGSSDSSTGLQRGGRPIHRETEVKGLQESAGVWHVRIPEIRTGHVSDAEGRNTCDTPRWASSG